ncbi:flagellar hook-basal body complex protein FliE [Lachnospiraceae bacterium YH-ros2226]|nr:flagellar hook-basal body complex protein FliE [Lachnospiraceae bacterium]MDD6449576.1 flagellar hook-basal body complex protein FliE [Lachnospiraceae bacterium]MDD6451231.1 flagellar hook-basal body complex protein FliE [Lachnospiraceae bacterium]MDD6578938.1 flagellar hook-basal body complex protein FliE [Lachnospiraceae bacterium]
MAIQSINSAFITPMKLWKSNGVQSLSSSTPGTNSIQGTGELPFSDVFRNAADQVKSTQAEVENQQYLLATGQLDDPHTLPIAESKAQISLDLMISLRNKAMESYKELTQMQI